MIDAFDNILLINQLQIDVYQPSAPLVVSVSGLPHRSKSSVYVSGTGGPATESVYTSDWHMRELDAHGRGGQDARLGAAALGWIES